VRKKENKGFHNERRKIEQKTLPPHKVPNHDRNVRIGTAEWSPAVNACVEEKTQRKKTTKVPMLVS
jgi:hypothetical protein